MSAAALAVPRADTDEAEPLPPPAAAGPTRRVLLANVVLSQGAWFVTVVGAAHGQAFWGVAAAAAVVGWHLRVSARPGPEARLVMLALLLGLAVETIALAQGHVRYPAGAWWPAALPPYWLIALWGLFAVSLNVALRWLRGRYVLAAAVGAVVGPLSYLSGVRLGAASFVDPAAALFTVALGWSVALPLLTWLAERCDGVGAPRAETARG